MKQNLNKDRQNTAQIKSQQDITNQRTDKNLQILKQIIKEYSPF